MVERLEKSLPEHAVVDQRTAEEPREPRRAVYLSLPFRGARRAEKDEVLEAQQRLGLAVAFLLFAEGREREAPIVPHNRARRKRDFAARSLQAPAEVHVVARLAIFRVESADRVKRPAPERHIAAGHMLRDKIREEHVARPAGARRDRGLHPVHRGRRNVRPADARVAAAREHGDEVVEPVGIGHAVAVRVRDHFAGRCVGADIARVAEAHVFLHHAHEVRELPLELRAVRLPLFHDLLRVVLRAVIHEHDFKVGIAHIIERA